ncbi:YdiU family protein [Kytococcus sedentarius]|uniref:protein adenylyltransferase SelO n=1 Tax=Kytococcus sedentarius TaxID=1276 RepID=UPI0035BC1F22
MGPLPRLAQGYAAAVPELSQPWEAAPVATPTLLALDEAVAADLGLDAGWLASAAGLRFLTGDLGDLPDAPPTVAQAYAGHQFGGFSPLLGDGRALLLGELTDAAGRTVDLHLKGSGRTPFARGGDGKAAVGPMLREHLFSVFAHAVGIPTTRSLAVVATGEPVQREATLPGALLARVASSHLRVGTVQHAAASHGPEVTARLVRYALQRHHPELLEGPEPEALALLRAVTSAQARLVAQWMGVGLVHGVMNTDNMTLSGETIDYGPVAMLEAHDPGAVFSSIDTGGRYAYGNQPAVAQWNLARLAEALLPLIDDDAERAVERATEVVVGFAEEYRAQHAEVFSAKLGLDEVDAAKVAEYLEHLSAEGLDHTASFRGLADEAEAAGDVPRAERLRAVNPVYVPRNHVVEEVLEAATAGDLAPFERLVGALRDPFTERPGLEDLAEPAPPGCPPHVTFCGT